MATGNFEFLACFEQQFVGGGWQGRRGTRTKEAESHSKQDFPCLKHEWKQWRNETGLVPWGQQRTKDRYLCLEPSSLGYAQE